MKNKNKIDSQWSSNCKTWNSFFYSNLKAFLFFTLIIFMVFGQCVNGLRLRHINYVDSLEDL